MANIPEQTCPFPSYPLGQSPHEKPVGELVHVTKG